MKLIESANTLSRINPSSATLASALQPPAQQAAAPHSAFQRLGLGHATLPLPHNLANATTRKQSDHVSKALATLDQLTEPP